VRTATPRHYLMVRPTFFDVRYSINPWMDPRKPTDTALAIAQWEWLRDLYTELGHTVEQLEPVPGLPDMVFAANGATVLHGKALVATFRNAERVDESAPYLTWFAEHGFAEVRQARCVNEGEGDYLVTPARVLAGSGFRTAVAAHAEFAEYFGVPVVTLTLVDPRYYHLDTALAVLDDETIMYYPEAFDADSRRFLATTYPDAITATAADAAAFGLNAMSDGKNVVLPQAATGLIGALRERGYDPIGADLSELLKAGGSVKCCTLELRA
jgi:N-dimethylarginine dimethylaminohydrolase